MFKRPTLLLMVLSGSIGVPYLSFSSGNLRQQLAAFWPTAKTESGAAASQSPEVASTPIQRSARPQLVKVPFDAAAQSPSTGAARAPVSSPTTPSRRVRSVEPAEILRFDVTSGWIMQRWERVSAGLADIDLQGYRVPLVTGTADDDLAGSLTYYFDKQQKVQRITFHGTSGNPRKLVTLLTGRYGFLRQSTDDPSLYLYQVKWNGKPTSELRIKPARVVRADAPHSRFEIELAMKRP